MSIIRDLDCILVGLSVTVYEAFDSRHYMAVTGYAGKMEKAEKLNTESKKEIIPNCALSRWYHINGVAELALNHPVKAAKSFAKAYKILPLDRYKAGYEFGKDWKNLSEETRKIRPNAQFAALPKRTMDIPDMNKYSSPEVASEHWIMRRLGYKGDIPYADMIKSSVEIGMTAKPHPDHRRQGLRMAQIGEVNEAILEKRVEELRGQMDGPLARGRLICWVGLNANQIGESSILDNPLHAQLLNSVSANIPKPQGCVPQ